MTRRPDKRFLINAVDAAIELRRAYHAHVTPDTIRQWAARRHIGSYGFKRERYDLREIVKHARDRGLIAP